MQSGVQSHSTRAGISKILRSVVRRFTSRASVGHLCITIQPPVRRLDRFLADKPLSTWRLSEYPMDYPVGISVETSTMAEQNTLRLPRVHFSDCRLRLLPLEQ
jgi:hypothetical protein